jgi:Domain of unknown function (DUF1918)
MNLRAGDRVIAESESTDRPPRRGTIDAVIVRDRRYRIRWDDGHMSVYTPAAGALVRADTKRAMSGARKEG